MRLRVAAGIAILGAFAWLGANMIPIYWRNLELQRFGDAQPVQTQRRSECVVPGRGQPGGRGPGKRTARRPQGTRRARCGRGRLHVTRSRASADARSPLASG